MKKVSIVLDFIPNYRTPFFEQLNILGKKSNIEYIVYTSKYDGKAEARDFSCEHLPSRSLSSPRIIFWHKNLKPLLDSDMIIMEQALHNPKLLWRFILLKNSNISIGFWGHGGYWTKKNSHLQEKILWSLVRRVEAFFVYSEEGAIRLVEHGYPLDNIAVLRNSIDTKKVYSEIDRINQKSHQAWREKLEINSTHIGCFIGDLRKEKRLNFLIDAILKIRDEIPDFQMLFFGNEALMTSLSKGVKKYEWIRLCGQASAVEKAQLSLLKPIIINPGRVGLIAVDSIAMISPMVTTNIENFHAPEIDFLSHPESICITANNIDSYVSEVVNLLKNSKSREKMSEALLELQPRYSIEQMALSFHEHVLRQL